MPRTPHQQRLRRLRKRLRAIFSRPLVRIACATAPALYVAYMPLVWATSRVEVNGLEEASASVSEHGGAVCLYMHEETIVAPWAYSRLGFRLHSLVNWSDIGEVAVRVAERCGVVVFRGGTSSRPSRRDNVVFRDMIEHLKSSEGAVFGFAIDGSQGPAYRMKRGPLVIARECGVPLVLARTWFRRCLRLPTWDRMALPLPFNTVRIDFRGPCPVPHGARERSALERFRLTLEGQLIELAAESYVAMGHEPPPNLVKDPRAESPPLPPSAGSGTR